MSKPNFFKPAAAVLLALSGCLAVSPSALAADAAATQQQQQQPGSIPCDGVQQDRAACRREAGAAKQERKTDGLTSMTPNEGERNALARCAEQPVEARSECEMRIRSGPNTSSQGSVLGGGIIRESVTPAAPASAAR